MGRGPRARQRAILVIQKWAEEEELMIEKQNKSSKKKEDSEKKDEEEPGRQRRWFSLSFTRTFMLSTNLYEGSYCVLNARDTMMKEIVSFLQGIYSLR